MRIPMTLGLALALLSFGCSGGTRNPDDGDCTPACSGKNCGDADGCGGKCVGLCSSGQTCNATTKTCEVCTPACTGAVCGAADGCGGKCVGTCDGGNICNPTTKACVACTPNCTNKACGASDGCGGKCVGTCTGAQTCNPTTKTCEAAACDVPASFGTPDAITDGGWTDDPVEYLELSGALNGDALPDFLYIELYKGGPLAGGINPGTYQLTGGELQYQTCAVCVRLFADIDWENDEQGRVYMATGGTLTITSTSGNFTGTLTNATFEEVTIASDYESSPVEGGCTSAITSVSFDSAITVETE